MKNIRTRKVIGAAMLAAVSLVLQFLELPMPLSQPLSGSIFRTFRRSSAPSPTGRCGA